MALAQTEEVLARLRAARPGMAARTVVIRTHGDEGYRRDLGTGLDGKRAFTERIQEALREGRIDIAVHSLKDLPTAAVDGVVVAAIPARADPRDVLVPKGALRTGARIGTSSLRRRAQLLAAWPDIEVAELRGNVGTRLRRLGAGDFDGVVVAAAGLRRLLVDAAGEEPLEPDVVTPAPGQGALAVEARQDDVETRNLLRAIEDPESRLATHAERALSARFGGGCDIPFGALATIEGLGMTLRAVLATPDGSRIARARSRGAASDWERVVDDVASALLERGARDILAEVA